MRTTRVIVIAGLCSVIGCEKDPRGDAPPRITSATALPAPAAPAPVPTVVPAPPKPAISARIEEPRLEPAPVEPPPPPAPPRTAPPVANGPLPEPPSVEPKAYAAWLRGLPGAQQRQIAAFCRKHRQDFETTCGGIGPLHIPYPPFERVRMTRPGDGSPTSLFASSEEWSAQLSRQQLAYIDRECAGGEDRPSSDLCGDNTPLVVAFDDQPIEFTRGGAFAFQAGAPTATDWPTATTPWIAFDRNGDGRIDHGAELFGSDTVLPDGTTAANGFSALAALDANHDGRIDASDPGFASLVLWADRDGDQRSGEGELTPVANVIVSISLANHVDARCDARGNCEGERATLTWRDAQGAQHAGSVVDVYLPRR